MAIVKKSLFDTDALGFIKEAIDKQVEKEIQIEIDKAIKRIEERRAEIIAGVLLHVHKIYEVERMGENIRLTVEIEEPKI